MADALDYLRAERANILQSLTEFASLPSISTDAAYATDIRRTADWVAEQMRRAGLHNVLVRETGGHPAVTADWLHAPGRPTILVYGHYDVQPPDPLEEWRTPPFTPTIRDDRLYARGISDDKAPMLIPIKVVEAFLNAESALPVNVKFLIEGEEEIGSRHLEPFIADHARELAADMVLSADGAMWRADIPSVTLGSRGTAFVNFTVTAAAKDLHSGRHGGAVANPLGALAKLLAGLHDEDGRVAVPGFYDKVRAIGPDEKEAVRKLPFDKPGYLEEIGAPCEFGEAGYELLERMWFRPTLEINGMGGGYQGPGTKTVLPCRASAKLSCRLVPGQDPEAIAQSIADHLQRSCPPGVRLEVETPGGGAMPYALPRDHLGLAAVEAALFDVYGQAPLRVWTGSTLPVCDLFKRHLSLDTVFFSFSVADEDFHAPNEFFRLRRLDEGLEAWVRCWRHLAEGAA